MGNFRGGRGWGFNSGFTSFRAFPLFSFFAFAFAFVAIQCISCLNFACRSVPKCQSLHLRNHTRGEVKSLPKGRRAHPLILHMECQGFCRFEFLRLTECLAPVCLLCFRLLRCHFSSPFMTTTSAGVKSRPLEPGHTYHGLIYVVSGFVASSFFALRRVLLCFVFFASGFFVAIFFLLIDHRCGQDEFPPSDLFGCVEPPSRQIPPNSRSDDRRRFR